MPYTVVSTAPAARLFRKLTPAVRKHLIELAVTLAHKPYAGEILRGKFRKFRSLHTKFENVHYRVLYEVDEAQQHIYIHAAGKRENFYVQLERMRIKPVK